LNPPTRALGPNKVMGQRLSISSAHAYIALDIYVNAIVLVRQHCLDPQAEDAGRRVVEFFGFEQPGCTVAGRLAPTTVLSLLTLFGSAQSRSPYLTVVWAQLKNADPGKVASAAGLLLHCLQAEGDVAGAIIAGGIAASSLLQTDKEEASRWAVTAAVLCALDDNVQLLQSIIDRLVGSPIWNTLRSIDLWQLATRYLDCGLQQRSDPLLPMRDLLLGGIFFVKGVSVARRWLGCACLWRMGEQETAVRIAKVVAQDARLALQFNAPFARALQQLV
jgi:hypothetical protein